ncbi:thiolase family protein [Frankia sp. Mgl5]|uniref:thiolase family protein n=1 Tax=Frankia sp. Mgl5 TaxID=2933793 RepID=UPI00200E1EA4|nr:thiolase family protein [Frankia sp. Mgl5]MCK9926399.1 thiolase family protein [Frankia sp. Mgl5]
MARNPLKDTLAVVGVGSTPYGRDLKRTELSLALEAAVGAIEDAGIDRQEIDGVCGTGMDPLSMGGAGFLTLQGALGIEKTTWQKNGWLGSCFVYAAEAVFSGLCDTVLVVQAYTRRPEMSRSAASDPFRLRAAQLRAASHAPIGRDDFARRWLHSGEPYAAWMARYLHDYGATKDVFARIAVNNRTHATKNPNAAMRTPITMEDYHASRVIWEPMQMLDMDVPVDCAEALIITTAERARDLRHKPVYVHAMSLGGSRVGEYYDNSLGWTENALWTSLAGLWERSDLTVNDLDLFFPYDGYTIDTVGCIEAAGFCKPGEASDLLASSWDAEANILRLGGHTLVTTNGGGLSQGRAGGFNFYTEAVRQLRGTEGERQVPGARTALLCPGASFFHDPASVQLRTD